MSIFKDCDIRGIYGTELNEDDARKIGRAIGIKLAGRDITVAGDVRVSTPALKAALINGLKEECAVINDIGIVPTPVAYFAKKTYGLAIVTASHNPAEYNGIKLMFGDSAITSQDIQELRKITETLK